MPRTRRPPPAELTFQLPPSLAQLLPHTDVNSNHGHGSRLFVHANDLPDFRWPPRPNHRTVFNGRFHQ